jgi:hypothetical protein
MNDLHYLCAKQRLEELRKQSEKEWLLKPYKLSWRVRSAKALHNLAQRLESTENTLETI